MLNVHDQRGNAMLIQHDFLSGIQHHTSQCAEESSESSLGTHHEI